MTGDAGVRAPALKRLVITVLVVVVVVEVVVVVVGDVMVEVDVTVTVWVDEPPPEFDEEVLEELRGLLAYSPLVTRQRTNIASRSVQGQA
jgi:hypothetical protein